MRSAVTILAALTALVLLVPVAAAHPTSGEEASASQCRDDRGRERSPSDCRILEQQDRREEAREEARRENLENACGRDPSRSFCVQACSNSAAEVQQRESGLERAKSKLAKSKKRLAAARRALDQASTERARKRAASRNRRRAAAVRRNKTAVRQAKSALRERRADAPSFCG